MAVKKCKIASIIVLYYPDFKLIAKTVSTCLKSCDLVILVNNSHGKELDTNKEIRVMNELTNISTLNTNVHIIDRASNLGLSKAYNLAIEFANSRGVSHYLILDQDSEVNELVADNLRRTHAYLSQLNVKFLLGTKNVRPFLNFADKVANTVNVRGLKKIEINNVGIVAEVKLLINSGMFLEYSSFLEIERYNEKLFMDAVDIDFCFRAKKLGYKLFECESNPILQNLNDKYNLTLLGINMRMNSAEREFHIIYDSILVARSNFKYFFISSLWLLLTVLIQSFLTTIISKNRIKSLGLFIRAFIEIFSSTHI